MCHISVTSRAMEKAAQDASRAAIAESKAFGLPVLSYDRRLKLNILEQPNGDRFIIEYERDGTHEIVAPLVAQTS